jgi:uncharacterized membrane protein
MRGHGAVHPFAASIGPRPRRGRRVGHNGQRTRLVLCRPYNNQSFSMHALLKFLHLAAAIAWLGGIVFMLQALRPVIGKQLAPPQRLPLVMQVLKRFFSLVWVAIATLLATGLAMLLQVGMKHAPLGWHLMLGIGLLMFALFGHLYFGPFRRLRLAVAASDWPEGGRRVGQIATLAGLNLVLGAVSIAAVIFYA